MTIIVPVFNEEKHVVDIIARLASMQRRCCEIIFVNDGSTDSTAALLAEHVPPNAVVMGGFLSLAQVSTMRRSWPRTPPGLQMGSMGKIGRRDNPPYRRASGI